MQSYLANTTKRDELNDELQELINNYGAEHMLWTFVDTLSTDKIDELIDDIMWALGEDREKGEE